MSRTLFRMALVSAASVALAAVGACSSSQDDDVSPPPTGGDDGGTVIPIDGGPQDGGADAPLDTSPPTCSPAGWCVAPLPDSEVTLTDIWPRTKHAFALGSSEGLGTKIVEWDGEQWTYIDDGSQNQLRTQATNVWAPSDDEVYYATIDVGVLLAGKAPFIEYVYRGERPAAPATTWSWTRYTFPCDLREYNPIVSGSSSTDVFVAGCRSIFRLTDGADAGDAGDDAGSAPSPFVTEYVDDDDVKPVSMTGITGTSADDMWFAGNRSYSSCAVILHRSALGYEKIFDGTVGPGSTCLQKGTFANLRGALVSPIATGPSELVTIVKGISGARDRLLKISALPGGGYATDLRELPMSFDETLSSVWGVSSNDLWMVILPGINSGAVLRGTNVWDDAGTFDFSTIALNGAPNDHKLTQIRGTSNSNLWVVGAGIALHQTTP